MPCRNPRRRLRSRCPSLSPLADPVQSRSIDRNLIVDEISLADDAIDVLILLVQLTPHGTAELIQRLGSAVNGV